ncbi:MAG: amino acid transporter ATPase, partial [Rhizobacter sp.]|nr:amino acid transporter ATPase [Rhizobacter sp.]
MSLNVVDLHVSYGAVRAVDGMSFNVGRGEVVALVGSNGAGKSSTLQAVMGLIAHRATQLTMDDVALTRLDTHDRIVAGVSLSPEGRHVFPQLSVRENIDLGFIGSDKSLMAPRREQMMSRFPRLREREWQHAGSLSGGEQQMLAIARAAMAGPRLLMLDEPTLGLAPIMVRELVGAIRFLRDQGMSVLLAEQNTEMALSVA